MKAFYPIITLTCLLSVTGMAGYAQTSGACFPNQKSNVGANVGAKHLRDNLVGETQNIQSKCFAQKEIARFQAAALPVALPNLATVWPKSGGSMTGQLTSLNQQELTISRNNASKSLPIAQVNNVAFQGDVWISTNGRRRKIRGPERNSSGRQTWQVPITAFQMQNSSNEARLRLGDVLSGNDLADILSIARDSVYVVEEIRFESPGKMTIVATPVDR